MAEINLDAVRLANKLEVIVHVKRMREFRIRMWFAKKLIWLGAQVGGFGFKIDLEGENG